ncbi:MAG: SEC-C metal-binding domain-containing protein [Bryobacteraceae bacterium]
MTPVGPVPKRIPPRVGFQAVVPYSPEIRTNLYNAANFAGLSEACLCGSGKKFTDCCLPKMLSGAA